MIHPEERLVLELIESSQIQIMILIVRQVLGRCQRMKIYLLKIGLKTKLELIL